MTCYTVILLPGITLLSEVALGLLCCLCSFSFMLLCLLCLVIFDFMLGTVYENSILFIGNTHDKYRKWHCFTFFNYFNAWLNITHTNSHIYFCFAYVVISHIPQSLENCTYCISKVKRRKREKEENDKVKYYYFCTTCKEPLTQTIYNRN